MAYTKMIAEVQSGKKNVDYYMVHDYKMAEKWLSNTPNEIGKVVKTIDHPFFIGMIVTGSYDPVETMLTCLQREVVDFYQIAVVCIIHVSYLSRFINSSIN